MDIKLASAFNLSYAKMFAREFEILRVNATTEKENKLI